MEFSSINVNLIVEGYHPRQDFNGKEELKDRIEKGDRIPPIAVRPEGDKFVVVDGKRRFEVFKELGIDEIESIIEEIDEKGWP